MKKNVLNLVASLGIVALLGMFASCGSDCYTCTDTTGILADQEICDDVAGVSPADQAAAFELLGYDCSN